MIKKDNERINYSLPTGFPSPAMDYLERRIDLNAELIKHPLATFFMIQDNDVMEDAHIPRNSLLIIDRSVTAVDGSTIVGVLNGEFCTRILRKQLTKQRLVAGNKKYPDIEILADTDFTIWSVVIKVVIDSNEIRKCMR